MLRVTAAEVPEQAPVPCDIYTAEGILLWPKGQTVAVPEQAALLRQEGWRLQRLDDRLGAPQETASAALALDDLATIRLPSRGRPPVTEAEALIADDMRLIRQLLTQILRGQGVRRVEAVDNGRDAVAHFFRNRPHMVFLDIDMPAIDGLAVLKQIKRWSPDSFVCMVSGHCTLPNVKQAKAYGVDAFLVKPTNQVNVRRVLAMYAPST